MPATSTSVPGKTILFGEHAVVYGYPAIAVPLDSISLNVKIRAQPNKNGSIIINDQLEENLLLENLKPDHTYRTAITTILDELNITRLPALEIRLSSTIPIASGLGSSAAFAVGLVRSLSAFLGFKLTSEKISEISYKIEVFQHGTPSGIDNTVIAFNEPVFYKKGSPAEFLNIKAPLTLVIADTGIRSTTKDTLIQVRKFMESHQLISEKIMQNIGEVVERARIELENGNLNVLGILMNKNHALLKQLGVSCEELDHLVEVSLNEGALGAKLCGSGRGGNIVALCDDASAESVKSALLKNGSTHCFVTIVKASKGVA